MFGVREKGELLSLRRHTVQMLFGQIMEDGFGIDIWPALQLS